MPRRAKARKSAAFHRSPCAPRVDRLEKVGIQPESFESP